jgi:hypothetical protein
MAESPDNNDVMARYVEHLKVLIAENRQAIDLMESGKVGRGQRIYGGAYVDTTQEEIAKTKRINETLEALVNRLGQRFG